MKKSIAIIAVAAGAVLPAVAADGDELAVTESATTFRLYINGESPYSLTNAADIAAWPVTWREGETVSAAAMDGTAYALADDAVAVGSETLPAKGGVWSLANDGIGTATVLVPWTVSQGDGVLLALSATSGAFGIDVVQDGPDRKSYDRHFPPIAYSGDDWAGDTAAIPTLTVTPPPNKGAATVFDALSGTGVQPCEFNKPGTWTVTLAMEDGTTCTAIINLPGGLIISFF